MAFFVSRYVLRSFVKEKIYENQAKYTWLKNFDTIDEIFQDKWQSVKMIGLLRLIMVPFGFMSYVIALTSVNFCQYLLGTMIYTIKACLYTFIGATVYQVSISKTHNG